MLAPEVRFTGTGQSAGCIRWCARGAIAPVCLPGCGPAYSVAISFILRPRLLNCTCVLNLSAVP